ncbi:hypothetical protein [Micromonospora sp. NBC_01638]|uniref:hypothetical protein n=1 Tax=Micromonospora sp. NBC_01638 TaxID=2975982 RepID=UPI003868B714|nr:hypothetical protein OG811_26030 [Micromonospora sp. NBC_01638]
MGEPYFEPATTDILAPVISAGSAGSADGGHRYGPGIKGVEPVIESVIGIA